MKKIIPLLLVCTAFTLCSKNKKVVTEFKEPKSIFLFNTSYEIEIFDDASPKAASLGKIKFAEVGTINASIEIVAENGSLVYYRMTCPSSLTAKCKDGYSYLGNEQFIDFEKFQSLTKTNGEQGLSAGTLGIVDKKWIVDDASMLREWLLAPTKIQQLKWSEGDPALPFQLAIYSAFPNPDDRLKVLLELGVVAELSEDSNFSDDRYESVFKRYAILKDHIAGELSAFGLNSERTTNLLSQISTNKTNLLNSFESGFPYRSSTYKGFVQQFNKFKSHLFLNERLFLKSSEKGLYTVRGLTSQFVSMKEDSKSSLEDLKKLVPEVSPTTNISLAKIVFKGREGIFLETSVIDLNGNQITQESFKIKTIQAEESGGSVGFRIKSDNNEIILTPLDVTDYLLSSGQGFKEFLSNLPKDYKDILKNNSYNKAVMLVAAKFGDGGFDETTGTMKYSFNTSKKYWTILEIIRLHPSLERETEYSGTLASRIYSECKSSVKWRQPKGSFYLSWLQGCSDSEENERTEEQCFYEGSSNSEIVVSFLPSDLRSEDPQIELHADMYSSECSDFFNRFIFR